MKITHISLIGIFTDNWTYQENLLTKYHKIIGYDVSLITSKFIYDNNGNIIKDKREIYINDDGVKIIRLNIKGNKSFNYKFKKYKDLYSAIESECPDILFIHGCQFIDISVIVKYVRLHKNVKVYVDNHADFSNSASNWLSRNILHKVIWKYHAHKIEPYVTKFFGVLPARVEFLKKIYKLPQEKVELLVMGADDEKVEKAKDPLIRKEIRERLNIKPDDFLIMTGGKIDEAKRQTLLLMQAIQQIKNEKVKLIVFGSVVNELKDEVYKLTQNDKIQYIGWIKPEDSYYYFGASDLVVFPGRHSVFWEQVAGIGIPMVVKYWSGTTHIDLGGNCKFLYKDSVDEIKTVIEKIFNDINEYIQMKTIAETRGMSIFSYKNIAKLSIKY